MIIPAAPTTKPVAFYDTECYRDFWLLKFRPKGGDVITFRLLAGETFDAQTCNTIRYLFRIFTTVSFNGNYYDVAMVCAATIGYNTDQLKTISDDIIVRQMKPWELNLPRWEPADHIDIIEVLPGAGSQKQFAGRIHYKTMRDLPYEPNADLTPAQIAEVSDYCENDLGQIEAEYDALAPQLQQRQTLSDRYGIDLRSKSDAQLAEAVLKHRCEQALGFRIYKPDIDWNLRFRYEPPAFLAFQSPQLVEGFRLIKEAMFTLGASGSVEMPPQIEGLEIGIGSSVYKLGIGGLHSQEKCRIYKTNETHVLRDVDVASYYPSLILNSGRWPKALGQAFLQEYAAIKDERLAAKRLEAKLYKAGLKDTPEWTKAHIENEGGKIMINGTFGKTGSSYSVLFAPEMLIQTTITGQLSLLMLIEWHELNGIPVVSANTDGIVINCSRTHLAASEYLIKEWEKRTGLEMEATEYAALYSRDVNNYFAVKSDGEVKRKGQYSKAGLVEKKNPDAEICSDAVADFLSKGTPLFFTIAMCRDIRKFVKIKNVTGGAVKMWGEGPREIMVKDIVASGILERNGWSKSGRKFSRTLGCTGEIDMCGGCCSGHNHCLTPELRSAREAYEACFAPQREEYLGKVIRWYYSLQSPGPIVYKNSGNMVSLSYGAMPCMTLPDEFPTNIDYGWYLDTAMGMLKDLGVTQ